MKDEVVFCLQMNIKGFLKLRVARHTQITQNNKFHISPQYIKKEVSDEDDSLYANKHERFLQSHAMFFDGDSQAFPKFPK